MNPSGMAPLPGGAWGRSATGEPLVYNEFVVQAHPGFFRLDPITDAAGVVIECTESPILAWRLTSEGTLEQRHDYRDLVDVEPITPHGLHRDNGAILTPTGEVIVQNDTTLGSVAAYIRWLNEIPGASK